MPIKTFLLWEPSSRSPLTVLLSFLCLFAVSLLQKHHQLTARIYFGCFSTATLVVGIALEKRFFSDNVEELDALDFSPGIMVVLGAVLDSILPEPMLPISSFLATIISGIICVILSLEYYFDGDLAAIRKIWNKRRTKKNPKPAPLSRSKSRYKTYRFEEGTFVKRYEVGRKLGSGFFGTVVVAIDKTMQQVGDEKNRCFAAKCVPRIKLSITDEAQIRNEVAILEEISSQHPSIVGLFEFYDEPANFYLILELMRGGELFDRINKKERYFEKDARIVIRTIGSALNFLHSRDIAHRDIKPENILMDSDSPRARIKLADFGFARKVSEGCRTACGTPNYVAPEIIDGSVYGVSVDIWALGVITYILLGGFPPFYEHDRKRLFKKIRSGDYSFPSPYFSLVSFEAQDFIKKCLTVDPQQRINADEILEHPWILGTPSQRKLRRNSTSERLDYPDAAPNTPELAATQGLIKLFNARTRLRAGILAAIAANRMASIAQIVNSKQCS